VTLNVSKDLSLHSAIFTFLSHFYDNPLSDEIRHNLLIWASEVNPYADKSLGLAIAGLLLNLIRTSPFDVEYFLKSPLRSFILSSIEHFPSVILQFFVEFQFRFPDYRSALDIPPHIVLALLSHEQPGATGAVFYTFLNMHRCGLVNFSDPMFADIPRWILEDLPGAIAGTRRIEIAILSQMISDIPDLVFGTISYEHVCQAIAECVPMLEDDFVMERVLPAIVSIKNWVTSRGLDESELIITAAALHECLQELKPEVIEVVEIFMATFNLGFSV
jgi:hypothetical protein